MAQSGSSQHEAGSVFSSPRESRILSSGEETLSADPGDTSGGRILLAHDSVGDDARPASSPYSREKYARVSFDVPKAAAMLLGFLEVLASREPEVGASMSSTCWRNCSSRVPVTSPSSASACQSRRCAGRS